MPTISIDAPMFSTEEHRFMQRALQLAEQAMFSTMPNPRVGCVLVKAGAVIGEGQTQAAGLDHAEVQALKDCERRGHDARGATAYVSLEPCSHFGRTPPCADTLVRAGVARVVAAMSDPNPLVAGNGFQRLRAAGVEVAVGLMQAQAEELNLGFVSRMRRGRPWLRLKIAASLDGKTALANGQSKWITSPEARADVQYWRARSCAMLTGSGTVLADDPQLTVRELDGQPWSYARQPLRVILDSRLQTPPTAKILAQAGVLIVFADAPPERQAGLKDGLQAAGASLLCLPGADGHIDLPALLAQLGARQMNEVTVEAGARLNGALLESGLVDEIVLYQAPVLLGDDARGMAQFSLQDLSQRRMLKVIDHRAVGPDHRWQLR
jgi:diaminohydroxyphosphoribosylaminopyrimidine deaminase/5-amino-6-(5-phosphoribosylamino)uracil reductase